MKPVKKPKENPIVFIGEGKRWKGNMSERSRECKTGTVFELCLEVRWSLWGWLWQGSDSNNLFIYISFKNMYYNTEYFEWTNVIDEWMTYLLGYNNHQASFMG